LHPVPGYRFIVEDMETTQVGAPGANANRVPRACTLPTAEQPLRVAEFDALFEQAVTRVVRVGAGRVRLDLRAEAGVAERVAKLAVAETGCCSFFTFALTVSGGALSLEITVPDEHNEVLDALAGRSAGVVDASA
jgi:hypothetical protein